MEEKTDIQLFNQLYETNKQKYIRFASSYVHEDAVAEDLVMESLMYYWERRSSLGHIENVSMYILTVLKHKCLNHLQRQRTWDNLSENMLTDTQWDIQMRISSLEACNPEQLFSDEVQQLLEKALQSMPEKSRQIFIMSRYEEKSYKEIASAMNLSVKSVEFHMSKVLGVLRKTLKDYLPLLIPVFDFFYNR